MRRRARAMAIEVAIIVFTGIALYAFSAGLLLIEFGGLVRFSMADVALALAAGVAAAAIIRATVRLHRRWKRTIGRFSAAAALCAIAAVAGALLVMIPGQCPGAVMPNAARCGVKEASSWGQAVGLATVVNFMAAGLAIAFLRKARAVVRAVRARGPRWSRALRDTLHRRPSARNAAPAPDPREPKGRPTPRRADAERARRERLRRV